MKIKEVIEFFAEAEEIFKTLLQKWDVLEEIEKNLFFPYLATTELQKVDICLTDFYGYYKVINMKLNQMKFSTQCHTNLLEKLLEKFDQRKSKFIDSPIMLCAIFLDPRFKKDLDQHPEKIQFVQSALKNIWEHMQSLDETIHEASTQNKNQPKKSKNTMAALLEELDELDDVNQMDNQCSFLTLQDDQSISSGIELEIHKYESAVKETRMKSSESVQKFWNTNKDEFGKNLFKIASAIYAVPPTQASVERTFSALKYLFTNYRYRLGENMLESLMLIHTNSDLYYLVKAAELKALEEYS